jgi:hypothetical protein
MVDMWPQSVCGTTKPNTNTYPEVLKTLARVIDGTPNVQTCEVVNSLP